MFACASLPKGREQTSFSYKNIFSGETEVNILVWEVHDHLSTTAISVLQAFQLGWVGCIKPLLESNFQSSN